MLPIQLISKQTFENMQKKVSNKFISSWTSFCQHKKVCYQQYIPKSARVLTNSSCGQNPHKKYLHTCGQKEYVSSTGFISLHLLQHKSSNSEQFTGQTKEELFGSSNHGNVQQKKIISQNYFVVVAFKWMFTHYCGYGSALGNDKNKEGSLCS